MKLIALICALFLCQSAYADCLEQAADRFGQNRDLLRSIAWNESHFHANAIHHNTDGSYDIGFMQINSTHLPWLKSRGINERALYDTCINIWVGTYILTQFQHKYGQTWRAVGAYGAGDKRNHDNARAAYATKIQRIYMSLHKKQQQGKNYAYQ